MTEPPKRKRTGWELVGWVLSISLVVMGLLVVAAGIAFTIVMNSWANNK